MVKQNQCGFSVVKVVLIFVIVGIIGFAGWFVWNMNQDDAATPADSSQADNSSEGGAADPTDDWVAYSNEEGDYSFKHPSTWVSAANPG